jgi:hypothetical protein
MIHDAQAGERRVLSYEEAWQVYVALNRNVSAILPADATDAERALASLRCHIGQPVRVRWTDGSVRGALRIAAGAPLVSRAAFDASLGRTRQARLAALLSGMARVLDKADLIVRHWPAISARSAVA